MTLALIAAVARNRVIGRNGTMPWHIADDLKRFKRITLGHTVLMGRKTYESLGKPLAGRRNVVLSSHPIAGVETFPSLEAALHDLRAEPLVFVIGGATVFADTLARVDRIYLTIVDQNPDGDTLFPPYEELLQSHFHLVLSERHEGFAFQDYVRRS